MKLLFCPNCWDMRRVSNCHEEPTICSCGKAQAQRKESGHVVWWNGEGLILEAMDSDLASMNAAKQYGERKGDRSTWLRSTDLYLVADGRVVLREKEEEK